jgi:hypothetical protein
MRAHLHVRREFLYLPWDNKKNSQVPSQIILKCDEIEYSMMCEMESFLWVSVLKMIFKILNFAGITSNFLKIIPSHFPKTEISIMC